MQSAVLRITTTHPDSQLFERQAHSVSPNVGHIFSPTDTRMPFRILNIVIRHHQDHINSINDATSLSTVELLLPRAYAENTKTLKTFYSQSYLHSDCRCHLTTISFPLCQKVLLEISLRSSFDQSESVHIA